MGEFKDFIEQFDCEIIPVASDGRVYLEEYTVSEDDVCGMIGGKHYDMGERYYDFLLLSVPTLSSITNAIVRMLYARGFSSNSFIINDSRKTSLQYSILSNDPWYAKKRVSIVVFGDITDKNDHRRTAEMKGKWMVPAELARAIGVNQTKKIMEIIAERHSN